MEKKEVTTRHHIIPKAQQELFDNVHTHENIHLWAEKPHVTHHARQEANHPLQTLHDYSFFTKVMSPKAKEIYNLLLSMPMEEFYDRHFVKHKKTR